MARTDKAPTFALGPPRLEDEIDLITEEEEEERFFTERPTQVAAPPKRLAPAAVPRLLRGIAQGRQPPPRDVVFLRARLPARQLFWWFRRLAELGLVLVAAALTCVVVTTRAVQSPVELQILAVLLIAAFVGGAAVVALIWARVVQRRWSIFSLEGIYLLPDAVVVWCGPSAVRLPRRLIEEVHFRNGGSWRTRTCVFNWRPAPGAAPESLVVGPEFGGFLTRDVRQISNWLFRTSATGDRDPFT